MRMTRLLLVALLASMALAGCSGSNDDGSNGALSDQQLKDAVDGVGVKATATTGVIRGIVVDSAIKPIVGADVKVRVGDKDKTTTTTDVGAFGFEGLEEGTYFVKVSKAGFSATQQSVDVKAGVSEPAITKVQLQADASFVKPYFESYVFKGFLECSAGGVFLGGHVLFSACSSENPVDGTPLFTNDHFAVNYTLAAKPTFVQSEMVWTSTQAASNALSMSYYYDCPDAEDGYCDLSAQGPSPLVNSMDNATAEEYVGEANNLQIRVFPWAAQDPGPAVAIEQSFDIYTHIFYGYTPPEGWRFSADGDALPPK